jgi:hypothetical protein
MDALNAFLREPSGGEIQQRSSKGGQSVNCVGHKPLLMHSLSSYENKLKARKAHIWRVHGRIRYEAGILPFSSVGLLAAASHGGFLVQGSMLRRVGKMKFWSWDCIFGAVQSESESDTGSERPLNW